MRFTAFTVLAAFVAAVVGQSGSTANPFNIPQGGYQLTAGKPTTLTWKPTTSGSVTLTLRSGASSALSQGTVIASSISNSGSYTYTPPSDTVRGTDYVIEISSDSDSGATNYTPPLVIESSNTVASASNSASVAASASASISESASASAASASESASASSASAASASESASASAASATKSNKETGSASTSATGTATSKASQATGTIESAPSNAANRFNVQGGLAIAAIGAAILI